MEWDFFICHATEDKDDVARPLTTLLTNAGYRVWIDELKLKLGQSLRREIGRALARSRFAVVIVSRSFFTKYWAQIEAEGFLDRDEPHADRVLPVWHHVDAEGIKARSHRLADRVAVSTDDGLDQVVAKIVERCGPSRLPARPRPSAQHPHKRLVDDLLELARAGGNNHRCIPDTAGMFYRRALTQLAGDLSHEGGVAVALRAEVTSTLDSLLAQLADELAVHHLVPAPAASTVTANWISNRLERHANPPVVVIIKQIDRTLHALGAAELRGELVRSFCHLGVPVVFTSMRPLKDWCLREDTGSYLDLEDLPCTPRDDPGWDEFSRTYSLDDATRNRHLAGCGGSARMFEALAFEQPVDGLVGHIASDVWARLPTFRSDLVLAARGAVAGMDEAAQEALLWGGILERGRDGGLALANPGLGRSWLTRAAARGGR